MKHERRRGKLHLSGRAIRARRPHARGRELHREARAHYENRINEVACSDEVAGPSGGSISMRYSRARAKGAVHTREHPVKYAPQITALLTT